MKTEIISIGSELTSGQNLDTNSQWLSQRLAEIGVGVGWHTTVADNLGDNQGWAALSPMSGTIPAGGTATLTITPRSQQTCGSMQASPTDFRVTVGYISTAPGGSGQLTIRDRVSL